MNIKLVERDPSFQRANKIVEFGGGDHSRAIALAELYTKKTFYSCDFRHERSAQENIVRKIGLQNISFIKMDVREDFFASNTFEYAFSFALMEHIAEVEQFLAIVKKILKPRGAYFFSMAPFWTSKNGHHFHHGEERVTKILDSYEHIKFSPREMTAYLNSVKGLPFEIAEFVRKIYYRPDLSRLSPSEMFRVCSESEFIIDQWELLPDEKLEEQKVQAVLDATNRYELSDFKYNGLRARLLKP